VGYQDIDFAQREEFSRLYLLRGEDEAAVRAAFHSDALLLFLERRPGMCAAGLGHELLFWRPGRLATPDEVEQLIQEGMELAERFAPIIR